jgi:hypothetical protein
MVRDQRAGVRDQRSVKSKVRCQSCQRSGSEVSQVTKVKGKMSFKSKVRGQSSQRSVKLMVRGQISGAIGQIS